MGLITNIITVKLLQHTLGHFWRENSQDNLVTAQAASSDSLPPRAKPVVTSSLEELSLFWRKTGEKWGRARIDGKGAGRLHKGLHEGPILFIADCAGGQKIPKRKFLYSPLQKIKIRKALSEILIYPEGLV